MPMYSTTGISVPTPDGDRSAHLFLCSEVRILTPKALSRMIHLQLDKYTRDAADSDPSEDVLVESETMFVSNAGVTDALNAEVTGALGEGVATTAYAYLIGAGKIPADAAWVDA